MKNITLIEGLVLVAIISIVIMIIASGGDIGLQSSGYNVNHDNHLFIRSFEGDLTHHPDCNCKH